MNKKFFFNSFQCGKEVILLQTCKNIFHWRMQFINLQIFLQISRFHCVIRRRNISQNSAIKLTRFLYLEKHCTIPISAILLHLIISHFAVIILILRMVFRCNAWLQFYSCTLPSSLLSSLSVGFSILSIFSFHWFHKFIQIIVLHDSHLELDKCQDKF